MNCPNCKNPVQESATICEWCSEPIPIKQNSANFCKCIERWEPFPAGITFKLVICPFCKSNVNINSYGKFECLVCKKSVILSEFMIDCPKCKNRLSIPPKLYDSKFLRCNLCNKDFKNPRRSGCFIATACYGDYNSMEVRAFRRFRDDVLLKSYLGRLFVSLYYLLSPPIADLISKSDKSKRIIRKVFLAPILNLIRK